MKITKQRLQQIIKEEVESLENEGVRDFFSKLKGDEDKTSNDVETSLDYITRLVNSPKELGEFMNLLPDAIRAATADGRLGSPDAVKAGVVKFIKKIAPQISVTVSNIDLKSGKEPAKPAAKPAAKKGRNDMSDPYSDPNFPPEFR